MTQIHINGLTGDIIAFIVVTTVLVLFLIGAFIAWYWIVMELIIVNIMRYLKVYKVFVLFVWYYNRGLKEKLKNIQETETE